MKFNPNRGLVNRTLLKEGDSINILTCPTHDPFEAALSKALPYANFYAYNDEGTIPGWAGHREQPSNYFVLERGSKDNGIPDIPFHLCLSQNPFAHLKYLGRYSQLMGIPLISLVHTNEPLGVNPQVWSGLHSIDAEHVFITDNSRARWGFMKHPRAHTIYHCVDGELFKPLGLSKQEYIVTIGNEPTERWRELGLDIQDKVTQHFPKRHVGRDSHNAALHNPVMGAENINIELNRAQIFGCFARSSPIPMSLVEAASAGCAILTTNNGAIPDVFEHKNNCYMFPVDRPEIGRQHLEFLLQNPEECARIGRNARELAQTFFSETRFSNEWSELLWNTIKKIS